MDPSEDFDKMLEGLSDPLSEHGKVIGKSLLDALSQCGLQSVPAQVLFLQRLSELAMRMYIEELNEREDFPHREILMRTYMGHNETYIDTTENLTRLLHEAAAEISGCQCVLCMVANARSN